MYVCFCVCLLNCTYSIVIGVSIIVCSCSPALAFPTELSNLQFSW